MDGNLHVIQIHLKFKPKYALNAKLLLKFALISTTAGNWTEIHMHGLMFVSITVHKHIFIILNW